MARSGQAATTKTCGFHAEVATIFLDQHIRRHFGGAEQAMQGRVDAHRLIDAGGAEGVVRVKFPARLKLNQWQMVGRIAVDLIGAGENKDSFWRIASGE